MSDNRARLAFGFLSPSADSPRCFWGIAGPVAIGAAFSDVMVEQLDLPSDPGTYEKIREIHADSEVRRGFMTLFLGVIITIPSAFGLWGSGGKPRSGNP